MVVVTVVAEEDMDQVMVQDSVEGLECHVPIAVVSTEDGKIFYIVLSYNPLTSSNQFRWKTIELMNNKYSFSKSIKISFLTFFFISYNDLDHLDVDISFIKYWLNIYLNFFIHK